MSESASVRPGARGPVPLPIRERFWPKVVAGFGAPHECWTWQGHLDRRGYGRVKVGSTADGSARPELAHRVSYELNVGTIPADMELHHTCCNPACVNPAHLKLVRPDEHPDRPSVINAAKTHCPRGHRYTATNTYVYRGSRSCRACAREKYHERKWRRTA